MMFMGSAVLSVPDGLVSSSPVIGDFSGFMIITFCSNNKLLTIKLIHF